MPPKVKAITDRVKGLTTDQRRVNILKAVKIFNDHLKSRRPLGSALNNLQCLGIAMCAREAVSCEACSNLPQDVCLRPGTNFFNWMERNSNIKGKENPATLFPASSETSNEKALLLINLVHAIVNHQHRLDEVWYNSALSAIEKAFLPPANLTNEDSDIDLESVTVRCHQILCEILAMIVSSHMLNMSFMAMGEKVPALVSIEEVEKASKSYPPIVPTRRMNLIKGVTRDKSIALWSPFFCDKDIDKESLEFKDMGEPVKKWLMRFTNGGHFKGPQFCNFFSPVDAKVQFDMQRILYVGPADAAFKTTFKTKCDGVTRYQVEVVAASYAEGVSCDF